MQIGNALGENDGVVIFDGIPLRYIKPDFVNAFLRISEKAKMYAYDAYFWDYAIRHSFYESQKTEHMESQIRRRAHRG